MNKLARALDHVPIILCSGVPDLFLMLTPLWETDPPWKGETLICLGRFVYNTTFFQAAALLNILQPDFHSSH